jgi:hypothetical protein
MQGKRPSRRLKKPKEDALSIVYSLTPKISIPSFRPSTLPVDKNSLWNELNDPRERVECEEEKFTEKSTARHTGVFFISPDAIIGPAIGKAGSGHGRKRISP